MRRRPKEIKIRMTEDEHQAYLVRLKAANLSGQSFGLKCLLHRPIIVIENMLELNRSLKAIGNNLNQIARAVNTGQAIALPVVAELGKGVNELWQWLRQPKAGRT
ncbi:MobC family plasmid mobilization relaxosome protein [Anaerospora hongkongensis]|uniref:MobC family plasmid mobilization relaxosome protein n=1 Tax=Anaerospora hongkongensis TaxID=244830 RepID=UPI00289F3A47|nr:MobC family plasmid mobilization relaxosome protein [Anaerospora hongkongensis]